MSAARIPAGSQPRLHGSTNTSSTRGFPETPLKDTAISAVPPDGAPSTAEFVNTAGVGAHSPPAAPLDASRSVAPSVHTTVTVQIKRRAELRMASLHGLAGVIRPVGTNLDPAAIDGPPLRSVIPGMTCSP